MILKRKRLAIALTVILLLCLIADGIGFWPNFKRVFHIVDEVYLPIFLIFCIWMPEKSSNPGCRKSAAAIEARLNRISTQPIPGAPDVLPRLRR